jgi:hypothetical protein
MITLKENHIGDLTNLDNMDDFIIGLPKCGTTSIQYMLESMYPNQVMKFHSDRTLEKHVGNNITTKSLIDTRKKIDRPFLVLVPYREPVARLISTYYQYGLPNGRTLREIRDDVRAICLGDYSAFPSGDVREIDETLVYENLHNALGIDILDIMKDQHFFPIVQGSMSVMPYVLEDFCYIHWLFPRKKRVPLEHIRKSADASWYQYVKDNIKFSQEELDFIYGSRGCTAYYTQEEIQKFKERYINV